VVFGWVEVYKSGAKDDVQCFASTMEMSMSK
jgi:hypothetical protein